MLRLDELRAGEIDFDTFASVRENQVAISHRARKAARRYCPWSLSIKDLYQEALIEVWRAVDMWNGDKSLGGFVNFRVDLKLKEACSRSLGNHRYGEAKWPVFEGFGGREIPYAPPQETEAMFAHVTEQLSAFDRDVVIGTLNGESVAAIARAIYDDEERRVAYKLPSLDRTWTRCRLKAPDTAVVIQSIL